jgi:hypothetical protein
MPTKLMMRIDGGHGADAPLPTLRSYARFFADTMPHTAITAIKSEISTL